MQVFDELKRYQGLLERPGVARALSAELEAALGLVDKHLDALQASYEEHAAAAAGRSVHGALGSTGPGEAGLNLPTIVNDLVWALQAEAKLKSTTIALGILTGYFQSPIS